MMKSAMANLSPARPCSIFGRNPQIIATAEPMSARHEHILIRIAVTPASLRSIIAMIPSIADRL
jgi:hypothetical protein